MSLFNDNLRHKKHNGKSEQKSSRYSRGGCFLCLYNLRGSILRPKIFYYMGSILARFYVPLSHGSQVV